MKNVTKQNGRGATNSNIPKLITATLVLIPLLATTLFLTSLVGCSKDDVPIKRKPDPITKEAEPTPEPEITPKPTPTLSGVSPESGSRNTEVTIFGSNFGADTNTIEVFFNGIGADVQTVNDTQVIAMVPVAAGTGLIEVIIDGITLTGPEFTYFPTPEVSTLAGGTKGFANGVGENALFNNPEGVAIDAVGNVYVADSGNNKIRKITHDGVVSTLVLGTFGNGGGGGEDTLLDNPAGIALDTEGNLYVADQGNHRIRKIAPSGVISTLAGGTQGYADGAGTTAKFYQPSGVAVDISGNVYVADSFNEKIRKITPIGTVNTLAGSTQGYFDGSAGFAKFWGPEGVAVDIEGNVYVADRVNSMIRKIDPNGEVSTLAGSTQGYADGTGGTAHFRLPSGVAMDMDGNVYVGDRVNHRIRKINPNGEVSTLAGSSPGFADGPGESAQFYFPNGLAVDAEGNIYVADTSNHRIRKITYK